MSEKGTEKEEALAAQGEGTPALPDAEVQGLPAERMRDMFAEAAGMLKLSNRYNAETRIDRTMAAYVMHNKQLLRTAGYPSFSKFCEAFGLPRTSILHDLKNFRELGEELYRALDAAGVSQRRMAAIAALPPGERPEIVGNKMIVGGLAYDFTLRKDQERLAAEFDDLIKKSERELKKAEREMAEVQEHGEKQIGALKKKNDALALQLLQAGFEVGGKRVGAADAIAQARELINVAIAKMSGALDEAKEGKKAFHDKICTQVIGLCEQLSRQTTNQSEYAARQLEEYEG